MWGARRSGAGSGHRRAAAVPRRGPRLQPTARHSSLSRLLLHALMKNSRFCARGPCHVPAGGAERPPRRWARSLAEVPWPWRAVPGLWWSARGPSSWPETAQPLLAEPRPCRRDFGAVNKAPRCHLLRVAPLRRRRETRWPRRHQGTAAPRHRGCARPGRRLRPRRGLCPGGWGLFEGTAASAGRNSGFLSLQSANPCVAAWCSTAFGRGVQQSLDF